MDSNLIMLLISTLITIFLIHYLRKQNTQNTLKSIFLVNLILVLIWNVSLTAQLLFSTKFNINPILFDYIAYIGICFLPVSIFFTGLIFANTKIKFKRLFLLLFIVPILSLLILWTNDAHNLFYINYSTVLSDTVYGPYMTVHSIYTYSLFAIALILLLRYAIKNAGFFSKQAFLTIFAVLIPIVTNVVGYLGLFPMTIYMTPISFSFTLLLLAIAIFKFKFLSSTPIALQRIVDRISDGYLVLDEKNNITDFNTTLLKMFNLEGNYIRNKNLFTLLKEKSFFTLDEEKLRKYIEDVKSTQDTLHFEKKLINQERYFNIEINSIKNDNTILGIVILFKDTTEHMLDMKTIKNNQNMLMERERLASLGQLIGGIAHNLKTPIMSIAGASEGLTDLVKEYEASVGDPEITVQDHHDIAKDMKDWIEKIKSYTEYMSDVITAVKGQAVTMSEEQAISFTLDELVKRINILMRHELKNALINLNISMKADEHTILKGNINSLVQVINNMISNSIQAYNGKTNEKIDLIISEENNNIIISIKDYGSGLPVEVQKKLFKEMITTKGKNGTGLGLFMSYSTIRAHFNGNISFTTSKGEGTTFNITLPV